MIVRDRVLKSATIIPPALYVERAADRQLQGVIEEMGRPGYVLVARQMGKTNLLLHARRQLERPRDAFVYIDFSLPAESLREQLRGITDSVISHRREMFASAASVINDLRKREKLPAHKEHENELRALLGATDGKIVLIFDEIDALTNSPYSDQLFSLVRSIYFSRSNFAEYGRLTYVLSGVAEPSELIKNKNISPFNIGEKIYLDDFTYDEFAAFLSKANLDLPKDVADRVYFWTAGNPRMTWDICASLEDLLLKVPELNPSTVDSEVQRLYFGAVDRAPIDHIRTIVADQRELRAAVREIRLGQANIGDQMRARLYLAGIVGSKFDSSRPKFKNRIIDSALSDDWLEEVDRRKRNALELARERFENRQYKDALAFFLEHLSALPTDADKSFVYYEIGYCHFQEERYQDAKTWFEKKIVDRQESLTTYLHEMYLLGTCDTYLGLHESAISSFQIVIDAGRKDEVYFQAIANQAAARLLAGGDEQLTAAESALRGVFAAETSLRTNMSEEEARKILIGARVNLGRVLEAREKFDEAIKEFETALDQCMSHERATLLTSLITLEKDQGRQRQRAEEAMAFVASYKPMLAQRTATNPLAFDYASLVALYGHATALVELDKRRKFGEYVRSQYLKDKSAETAFTFDVATNALAAGQAEAARTELSDFLNRARESVSQGVKTLALKLIIFRNRRPDAKTYRSEFLDVLEKRLHPQLDLLDMRILLDEITEAVAGNQYGEALRMIRVLNAYKEGLAPELVPNLPIFEYFEMTLSMQLGDVAKAKEIANRLIGLEIKDSQQRGGLLFSLEDAQTIRSQAKDIVESVDKPAFLRNVVRYGRNEQLVVRYKNGRTAKDKFKRLKADLEAGLCFVIERSEK